MVDSQAVFVLVQAGGVGIALAALGLVYYTVRVMANHLSHTGELLGRIAEQLDRISTRLEHL